MFGIQQGKRFDPDITSRLASTSSLLGTIDADRRQSMRIVDNRCFIYMQDWRWNYLSKSETFSSGVANEV
jgi:hypothetical protein